MMSIEQEPGGWRPLLRISTDKWLGERQGHGGTLWTGRVDGSGAVAQVDLEAAVGCLPLLERTYAEVRDEWRSLAHGWEASTRAAVEALIPGALMEAALRSGSSYWLERAAQWLDVLAPSGLTACWASSIESSVGTTQSTRHAARRARRRWPCG